MRGRGSGEEAVRQGLRVAAKSRSGEGFRGTAGSRATVSGSRPTTVLGATMGFDPGGGEGRRGGRRGGVWWRRGQATPARRVAAMAGGSGWFGPDPIWIGRGSEWEGRVADGVVRVSGSHRWGGIRRRWGAGAWWVAQWGLWSAGPKPRGGSLLPFFYCFLFSFYLFSFLFLDYLKCQSILQKLVHPTIIMLAILDNPRKFLVLVLKLFIFALVLIFVLERVRI